VGDSSAPVKDPLENPIKSGLREADKYGRRWKFVAGTLSPNALPCAIVPDGPGCKWEGGSFERIEAQNRAALKSQLEAHLADFINAYNYARRLKTLKGLTPYEYICKCWTSQPERFRLNPLQKTPGLNTYHLI
jgi:hypothetical protein